MKISKEQYKRALQEDGVLKSRSVELLNLMYDAPDCAVTSSNLASVLGYKDFPPVNALIGKLGKRIAESLEIELPERKNNSPGWWQILAHGEDKEEGFTWTLRDELFYALVELGLLDESNSTIYPEVVELDKDLYEGKVSQVTINKYERNRTARSKCLEHYGNQCSVCEINFADKYGKIGDGFIHVHHILELSQIGKEYRVNPIQDLRPVCPNCHSMIHRKKPAFTINELKQMLNQNI